MKRMTTVKRHIMYLCAVLMLFPGCALAGAKETEGLKQTEKPAETEGLKETEGQKQPEVDYDSDIPSIHIGQTHVWKPFIKYPDLTVSYRSGDPGIVTIAEDGTITPVKKGETSVYAATPRTDTFGACETELFLYVLPEENGLYLTDTTCHFYYKGKEYQPGELPFDTEKELCLTHPALKRFIEDYLSPLQKKLEPTEAVLTAILNYGSQYFDKNFPFEKYGSSLESGKTDWMLLLYRKQGLCAYNASLLCYLMYLSGLPAMQVDSPVTESRAHSWNLIEHNGFYYNLEEYHFLHKPRERYVIPPLSKKTAAYFPGHIIGQYAVHFPQSGKLDETMKFEDLGRDLTQACPVLMYERGKNGEYLVRFEEIRKDHIPVWADGTPLKLEEITYKNMETDTDDDQYNKEAKPLFDEANKLLWEEIRPLMEK